MESPFGSTLLVTGPESLLAQREVGEFVGAAVAERSDAAVNRVAAEQLTVGELATVTGGSLLADSAVVVIENLPELPAEVADALVAIASRPGPELALAIVHPGGVKGKAVLDRLKKVANRVVDFPALKPKDLPQFVTAEARRAGSRIDRPTADALISAVGNDLNALAAAVRQLLDDADGKPLNEAAVRRYFGGRAEVRSYEIAGDALAGETASALEKLRWALATGVGPPQVTAAVAANLRELGKYLDAADGGMHDSQIAGRIGVPPWKVRMLAQTARQWRPAGVARAIQAVAQADAQVKGAGSDAGFALEQLVLTVIGCRGRR